MLLYLALACSTGPALSPEAERGRTVYQANCTACHNADPALDGPLGPSVKGSSRALLEARVVRGKYPEGYKPKRDTTLMQPLPAVSSSIDDLAAYLQ